MKYFILVVAALVVAGCASSPAWQASAVEASATSTYNFSGELRLASDHLPIQTYSWIPVDPTAVRGCVVIIHGLKDHATRYQALAEDLTKAGFAVYAQDLRGHARSAGDRQRIDSFAQVVDDVNLSVERAEQAYPGKPLFLFGHSLGGLISAHFGLKQSNRLHGLILSGPALKLQDSVSGVTVFFARMLSFLAPGVLVQDLGEKDFVRTPAAFADMQHDPLISHDNLPARTAAVSVDAIDEIQRHLADFKLPLLILHGAADVITNRAGSRQLFDQSPSPDKKLELIDQAYHDLMHEPEADRVRRLIVDWVISRS